MTARTRFRHCIRLAIAFAIVASSAHAGATGLIVYDDSLENGFEDFSYGGGSNFSNPSPVHGGTFSIALTGDAYNAVSMFHDGGTLSTSTYPTLTLWVHGGSSGGQQLELFLQANGSIVAEASLNDYLAGGAPTAGTWKQATITFAQAPLSYSGAFDRIDIQSNADGTQPTVYFDDISLGAPGNTADPIFANGFEASAGAPPLQIEHDVSVNGMTSDRYTWRDAGGQPRSTSLAHNDGPAGPGGTRGGEMRQFTYQTGSGTRTANASGSGASGFGYPVSHAESEDICTNAPDYSPLGHFFGGTFTRVFEGRHHAILRFTSNYPRYCTVVAPAQEYDLPVTIDWLIQTGHDDALWAITWDMTGVPAERLSDDSRAPYGELLFDGAPDEGSHSVIAGVEWGDRYKFTTTSTPVTFDSSWDWSATNTIPYVDLWTTAVDATMGVVQTQSITQHDAGGYYGTDRWGTTSAAGPACDTNTGDGNYVMPCDFNWPYQSINYSLDIGQPDDPTNNTRLAWGSDFGFLGSQAYPIHGSAYYGGPLGDQTAVGWPYQSYSTLIVLGERSANAVGSAVAGIEALQAVNLSASVGSVATGGAAGIARADTITYQPAGYDPVYAALRFGAAGGALTANIGVGSGTLHRPLVIVGGIATLPSAIRLGGAPLAADVDYFASLRSDTGELWLTLNRDLSGTTNALQITP